MSTVSNPSSSGLAGVATLSFATPALGKGAKAAREFEAQLIGTVLESLEKSFNYLGTQALASAVADGGGFGIAKLIAAHLEERR
jgi:hypothetical protein